VGQLAEKAGQPRDSCGTVRDSWEWIEERAAIMQYDGGLSRDQANAKAFELWFATYIGGQHG
jgi:hypothetical protein